MKILLHIYSNQNIFFPSLNYYQIMEQRGGFKNNFFSCFTDLKNWKQF